MDWMLQVSAYKKKTLVSRLNRHEWAVDSTAPPPPVKKCESCISVSNLPLHIFICNTPPQELVDVYVEYPFFVRGQGWSSCSPQRTARLCGLQCRQLSVGDVCLALTPVTAPLPPPPPPSATTEPKTSPRKSEGGCESLKAEQPQVPPGPDRPDGGRKKEAEVARRRHYSAPELRGPGTNCM